jgi:pimeloyl-ACP methyl ester carboxylesterase
MKKHRLRHIIVIIPGISGSVLKKDGKDLWAFSTRAVSTALFERSDYLEALKLTAEDDPALDDLGDGIEATEMIPDYVLIPGFIKLVEGYTGITQILRSSFEVVGHGLHSEEPTNLIEFPYDWRRDNRVTARRLNRVLEERLHRWRLYTQDPDAKVIFLVHSMGGLVARHHLEVLEGWRDCLALLSLGTPYRGSMNALNFLVNGYRKATLDLSTCLRSFTSTYQLLPTYPVIDQDGSFHTVEEIANVLGISAKAAASAAGFHADIAAKVRDHLANPDYAKHRYQILPFVGIRQSTLQSAVWSEGRLTASQVLPPEVNEILGAGDGTVPRYSAVPEELDNEFRETFLAEKHGALQASRIILQDVLGRLQQMQVPHIKKIRGPEITAEGSALSLEVEDIYLPGEPVQFYASLVNDLGAENVIGEVSRIHDATSSGQLIDFQRHEEYWEARVQDLPEGMYVIEVRTETPYPLGPPPVHDLFEVV